MANGARFMVFPYLISLAITERYSEVRLVRPGEPTRLAALPYDASAARIVELKGPISSLGRCTTF